MFASYRTSTVPGINYSFELIKNDLTKIKFLPKYKYSEKDGRRDKVCVTTKLAITMLPAYQVSQNNRISAIKEHSNVSYA